MTTLGKKTSNNIGGTNKLNTYNGVNVGAITNRGTVTGIYQITNQSYVSSENGGCKFPIKGDKVGLVFVTIISEGHLTACYFI